jgi:hypothetical protein
LARLNVLEERLATLEASRPQLPADRGRAIWMRQGQSVVFRDTVPVALVELMANGEPFDGEVREHGDMVVFVSADGREVARVPKSLSVVLDGQRLLRTWSR